MPNRLERGLIQRDQIRQAHGARRLCGGPELALTFAVDRADRLHAGGMIEAVEVLGDGLQGGVAVDEIGEAHG